MNKRDVAVIALTVICLSCSITSVALSFHQEPQGNQELQRLLENLVYDTPKLREVAPYQNWQIYLFLNNGTYMAIERNMTDGKPLLKNDGWLNCKYALDLPSLIHNIDPQFK